MARFRLLPLLDVGKMRLDSAEQRLALLRQRWNEAQSKLSQLDQFKADYSEQFMVAQRAGIQAYRQQDYLAFLAKLDVARSQQSEEVMRCKQSWEAVYEEWLDFKTRYEALLTLQERHLRAEQIVERRQEQKQQDEFAARRGMNLPDAP